MHVHHHTLLQSQGGTARVAQTLVDYLYTQGVNTTHSYELQDQDSPNFRLLPQQVGLLTAVPASRKVIHHLHASLDWPACLNIFAQNCLRPVITLHDCKLLTGGCAFPLDCENWRIGCPKTCPQGLLNTGRRWTKIHALITAIQPKLVTPSAWLAKMARTLHPHAHIQIIANGISSQSPHTDQQKETCKKNLGINPQSKVVLFIAHGGAQAANKGGHLWTTIWNAIKVWEPHAVALAVGGDELKRTHDYLEFPYLDQSILDQCLKAADVLIYPSLADNHPLVVLEAMSCQLPCVAFAVGGIPEQIVHGQTGLLVPKGDVDMLANYALRILQQPLLKKRLRSQSLKRFQNHFTSERMGEQYLHIYSRLMADMGN